MPDLDDWNVAAASNNSAAPDGFPEGQAPSTLNDASREVMAVMARFWKDTNGELQLAGSANAYTVTLNAGYAAYFQGMMLAAEVNLTNTGATTINVNGIGTKAVVNRNSGALTGNELIAGGIYEFRYDGTNFQLMGALSTTADLTIGSLFLNDTSSVDLANAIAPLVVSPGSGQHLEFDGDDVQAKSDETTAAGININRQGGDVAVGAQIGSGSVLLYEGGSKALETRTNGVSINPGSTGNNPNVYWRDSGDVDVALAFYDVTANEFHIRTIEAGAPIIMSVRNVADGATETGIVITPDGAVTLRHDNTARLATASTGIVVTGPGIDLDRSSSANAAEITARNSEGGVMFRANSADLVVLQTDSAGATEDTWIQCLNDNGVYLFFNSTQRFATTAAGADVFGQQVDIDNSAAATQAQLRIRNSEGGLELRIDDQDFGLWRTNSAGTPQELWIDGRDDADVALYCNGLVRFATTLTGADISNAAANITLLDIIGSGSNQSAKFGLRADSGGGRLIWDETALNFDIRQTDAAGSVEEDVWIRMNDNGAVELFYNGTKKLQTADETATDQGSARALSMATATCSRSG